jgi:predicted MPP superfamily phosphohydrolase
MRKSLRVFKGAIPESKLLNKKTKPYVLSEDIFSAVRSLQKEKPEPDIRTIVGVFGRGHVKTNEDKQKIEEIMAQYQIQPNIFYFTCLLNFHMDRMEFHECQRVIDTIMEQKIELDIVTLTILLKVYHATQNHEKLGEILELLYKQPKLDLTVWNTLLEVYSGDSKQVDQILQRMGIVWSRATYNILLKHYVSINDYGGLENTLIKLKESKLIKTFV